MSGAAAIHNRLLHYPNTMDSNFFQPGRFLSHLSQSILPPWVSLSSVLTGILLEI
ncbi:hypothetical protein EMGR_005923 [Emarellia grisea]|jgi:hypothetical protein